MGGPRSDGCREIKLPTRYREAGRNFLMFFLVFYSLCAYDKTLGKVEKVGFRGFLGFC